MIDLDVIMRYPSDRDRSNGNAKDRQLQIFIKKFNNFVTTSHIESDTDEEEQNHRGDCNSPLICRPRATDAAQVWTRAQNDRALAAASARTHLLHPTDFAQPRAVAPETRDALAGSVLAARSHGIGPLEIPQPET